MPAGPGSIEDLSVLGFSEAETTALGVSDPTVGKRLSGIAFHLVDVVGILPEEVPAWFTSEHGGKRPIDVWGQEDGIDQVGLMAVEWGAATRRVDFDATAPQPTYH